MEKHIDYKKIAFTSIPIFIFIVSLFFCLPLFATNDDTLIMNVLSGRLTGSPYPCTSFFSIFLGYIISSLYKIAYLPWYPAFILISIIIGQMCIFTSLYDLIKNKNLNIISKAFFIVFFTPLATYILIRASFSFASTLLGVASIYFLNKKKLPLSLFLLMLSTMIRYESGFVACAFWGINYIYLHFSKTKKITLKFVIIGILALVLVLGLYFGDELIKSHIEPKEYKDFRVAMHNNVDYIKTKEFENNKEEILKSLDFNQDLYTLCIKKYFTMDSRIDNNKLSHLNSYSASWKEKNIIQSFRYALSIANANPFVMQILLLLFITNIFYIFYALRNSLCELLFALSILLLNLIFLHYLSARGRILIHSLMPFVLSSVSIIFIQLINIDKAIFIKSNKVLNTIFLIVALLLILFNRILICMLFIILASLFLRGDKKRTVAILAIFIFAGSLFSYHSVISSFSGVVKWSAIKNADIEALEKYAFNHRDNIYITSNDIKNENRMIMPKYSTYNLFSWGGTNVHSSSHIIQMQKAGLKKFDVSELAEPNIYFADYLEDTWSRDQIIQTLQSKNIYGSFELVDNVNNKISIFMFNKK